MPGPLSGVQERRFEQLRKEHPGSSRVCDEDFSPLYDKCGARAAHQLENATALGSRIPPHAVLLHVNNTPVKLKIIFAI